MPTTVEVRFKGNRKDYFLWLDEVEGLHLNDPVIVEADRGIDFGRVTVVGDNATKKCESGCAGCAVGQTPPAPRNVVRVARQEEVKQANDLRRSEEDARRSATERVRHHQLEMKISDAEWQWDRKKLTLYFTAEKRVDFRDLVRDLASTFKTRIELRQIGVRDEAARLGGVGRCGKEYCCSTWLRELSPVSLSLAKDQHLSLNPAQISGGCGRLLCCLKYEHEFYVTSRKRFPKEGKALRTARGTEKVIAVDIFRERVFLRHDEHGPRIITLIDLKDELAAAALLPQDAPAPPAAPAEPRQERRPDRPDRSQRAPRPPAQGSSAPAPPAPPATPAPSEPPGAPATSGEPAAGSGKKRSKRRRRRGHRPGGGAPPPTPES